jgi:hypothetical protein
MTPREGELRVERERLSQPFDSLEIARAIAEIGLPRLNEQRVGFEIVRRALLDLALLRRGEIGVERSRDLLSDLTLHREHVRQVAVVLV